MAGECKRRQRVESEDLDLEHLQAWSGPVAVRKPRLIGDPDHAGSRSLGDVVDPDEARHLHPRTDLFQAFASRRIPRILIVIDESTGQAPLAETRLDRAASQENSAVDLDHHCGRHLGVVPKHEIVVGTALDLPAFDHARHELGATVDAVVRGPA
jgi:hypothetical protein